MRANTKFEKSGKRETSLINTKIMKRTEDVFPEEVRLILASTNLARRITSISQDAINEFSANPSLSATMNLFARNRELVHFAMVCLLNGGYASTKVLSRASLENSLCMRLLNKRPELAKEWFTNPDMFRERWAPNRIRNELFPEASNLRNAYDVFYGQLCNYAHPSFKGWSEQIKERSILWRPIFDADYASECLGLIFFVIVQSFMQFVESFKRWFPDDLIEEVNVLLPKDSQMVRRHFQILKNGKMV